MRRLRLRAVVRAHRAALTVAAHLDATLRARALRGLELREHAYGPHPLERLDHLGPVDPLEAAPPIAAHGAPPVRMPIVYVHGGGWVSGCRALYRSVVAPWARAGHVVVNVDYPLAPESPFPRPLASVLRALRWVRAHVAESRDGVALVGDSAGGNLAVMAGMALADPALLERVAPRIDPAEHPPIAKLVSLYGVLDRLSWLEDGFPWARVYLESYAGAAAFARGATAETACTPMDVAHASLPPTLLAVGTRDPLQRSTELFYEHARTTGLPVERVHYAGEPHGFLNYFWRPASRRLSADVLAFVRR